MPRGSRSPVPAGPLTPPAARRHRAPAPQPRARAAQGSLARGGRGEAAAARCARGAAPVSLPRCRAMAAPPASPGPRGRFEQEQDRAVRALVRCVTSLPEEELGGERFQAALNFAWSNFRSAGAWRVPVPAAGCGTGPRARPEPCLGKRRAPCASLCRRINDCYSVTFGSWSFRGFLLLC